MRIIPPKRSSGENFAARGENVVRFWRIFLQIFVLHFPGPESRLAARSFLKILDLFRAVNAPKLVNELIYEVKKQKTS